MKAKNKKIILLFLGAVLILSTSLASSVVFADSGVGGSGGGVSGTCKETSKTCVSGVTFVRKEVSSSYPDCSGFEYVAVLVSVYTKYGGKKLTGKNQKPSDNERKFSDIYPVEKSTYKNVNGSLYTTREAAEEDYNLYSGGDSLSNHPDNSYFCVKPNTPATLYYNANGGTAAPSGDTCYLIRGSCSVTVSSSAPTRTGYSFAGWADSPSASAPSSAYSAGSTVTLTGDKTVYAVWNKVVTVNGLSSVAYAGNVKSVTSAAETRNSDYQANTVDSSGTGVYALAFSHALSLSNNYLVGNKNHSITYNIEQKEFSGAYDISQINTDAGWTSVDTGILNTTSTDTWNWDIINPSSPSVLFPSITVAQGETRTICQRLSFANRVFTYHDDAPAYTAVGSPAGWGGEVVCQTISRLVPVNHTMSATSEVSVDSKGYTAKPENPYVSTTTSPRAINFRHKLAQTSSASVPTDYTIVTTFTSSVDGTSTTTTPVKSTTVPSAGQTITTGYTKTLKEAEVYTICEHIEYTPSEFLLHSEGSIERVAGKSGSSAEICGTIAMPGQRTIDDGEIIVSGSSTASILNNSGGSVATGPVETYGWLLKGNSADIGYTHTLSRNDAKHIQTGESAWVPKEDVKVYYLMDEEGSTHSASGFPSTYSTIISNNSSQTVNSNKNDSAGLLNKNTVATINNLGIPNNYCQSIFFLSEKYTLRGKYWMLGDGVFPNDDGSVTLLDVDTPTSQNIVGKSSQACITLTRPYNFFIEYVRGSRKDSSEDVVYQDQTLEAGFTIHVEKDKSDFLITSIPNATVRTITFIMKDNPGSLAGSREVENPCGYFEAKGATNCKNIEADKTIEALSPNNKNTYYPARANYDYSITAQYGTGEANVGEKICIALAVAPEASGTGFEDGFDRKWVISNATCNTVGVKPSFEVWGGSTISAGGIKTSISTVDNPTERIVVDEEGYISGTRTDVAFVIDVTSSMSTLISSYIAEAQTLASKILSSGGKVALYAYADAPYVNNHCNFTDCTQDKFNSEISKFSPVNTYYETAPNGSYFGGGDYPESAYYGAKKAIDEQDWTAGGGAVIILTDAPSHDPDSGVSSSDLINAAKAKNISIYVLYSLFSPTISSPDSSFYDAVTFQTGGKVYGTNLEDFENLIAEVIPPKTHIEIDHHIRYFGSWDEFAVISKKANITMASGTAFNSASGEKGISDESAKEGGIEPSISPLTIANKMPDNDYCGGSKLGCSNIDVKRDFIQKIYDRYVANYVIPSTDETTDAPTRKNNADVIYGPERADTPFIVTRSTFEDNGFWKFGGIFNIQIQPIIIYKEKGDIIIKDDLIYYPGTFSKLDTPQAIILAKNGNIYIDASVERIDGWLLASGNIHTCAINNAPVADGDDELATSCGKHLTINGPVVSNSFTLRRTLTRLAPENTTQDSAEIVNFSPSAIFFGANEAQKAGQPITTYLHKLSPRY